MTQKMIHDNESIFPYSEVYVTLAKLFGRFDMKLCSTERVDVEQFHDFFSPFPESPKGLRVTVE